MENKIKDSDEMWLISEEKPEYHAGKDVWKKFIDEPGLVIITLEPVRNGFSFFDQYGRMMDVNFVLMAVEGLIRRACVDVDRLTKEVRNGEG
jgi:hypothetical protein